MKKLTEPELDEISEVAVKSAEKFIFSRISKKEIIELDINVEVDYGEGLDLDVQVDLVLDGLSSAAENIAAEAAEHSLEEVDKFLESLL